jgi:hypothetical protein
MRVRVLVVLLSMGILLAVWATGITINRLGEGSFYVADHWTVATTSAVTRAAKRCNS